MLTSEQKAQFEREGYLVLPAWLDAGLLQRIEREYDALLDEVIEAALDKGELSTRPDGNFLCKLRAVHRVGVDWFQPLDISLPGG
ncbi:MAG: phytanoyl-CoA dioxygenase, partial [Pseudomonadota bacterium]